jgi:hypothetical protein
VHFSLEAHSYAGVSQQEELPGAEEACWNALMRRIAERMKRGAGGRLRLPWLYSRQ